MAKMIHKRFESPDEIRVFEKGRVELVKLGEGMVGRMTLEPGWRWSQHVKPIANTSLCESPHFAYHISGRMHFVMEDGTEFEAGPGEVIMLTGRHNAWVVGNETVVIVDWSGVKDYAEKR